jgi:glyoxylase-like metal-dependent hydrolase (beta-lactamase superfamily II)
MMDSRTPVDTAQSAAVPELPGPGQFAEVADDIFALNVAVPFKGLRQVALWLLRGPEGWTMIDCGWGDAETRAAITNAFDTLLGGEPLVRLIVTHFHPDHMGNCRWICDRWGILPQVTRAEWFAAKCSERLMYIDDLDAQARFFEAHSIDPALLARYKAEFILYDRGVAVPSAYLSLQDGQTLTFGGTEWEVLAGAGHSPEMATFYSADRQIYISADQVLPRISSNVGVNHWEPSADPLKDFLHSLGVIAGRVPPGALVLPSHGNPFRDAPARIRDLARHHEDRLDHLMSGFHGRASRTAGACMATLFGKQLDGTQIGFAAGETIAHLNHLVGRRRLQRVSGSDRRIHYEVIHEKETSQNQEDWTNGRTTEPRSHHH